MMDIDKASEFLKTLLAQTDKKRERKVYNCFIRTLASLKKRDLTEDQLKLIDEKLASLNLKATTKNKKKYYKQRLSEFRTFLKDEFSFTTEKYYTELGMIYGMIFGTSMGLTIGMAINPAFGTSIGMSIGTGVGMVIGMMYGARKDTEAKRLGRVI
jgi:F0F1-type ATP synthase assembly protein I